MKQKRAKQMNYDEAIQKAESLIAQLESEEALGMEEYKKTATEVTALLKQCQSLLAEMHEHMTIGVENL